MELGEAVLPYYIGIPIICTSLKWGFAPCAISMNASESSIDLETKPLMPAVPAVPDI